MEEVHRRRPWEAPAGVAALVVGLWVLGHLPVWAAGLAAALLAPAAWVLRALLYRVLTGLPFAGSLLTALLLATAAGTFVPQGLPPEALEERYGKTLSGLLRWFGFDDLFHSFAFRGMLAALALCMILVILRRRAWRPPEWGPFLAHAGVATLLAGGLIGSLWGRKGLIELRQGESSRSMKVQDSLGRPTGKEADLGFALRLDRVEMERYPEEYRLYLYRSRGERHEVLASVGTREAGRWRRAGSTGPGYRLLRIFPDFEIRRELREAPPGMGVPALQLRLEGREPAEAVLLAGVKDREELRLDGDLSVRFVRSGGASLWSEGRPEEHRILVGGGGTGDAPAGGFSVRPGASYPLEGGRYDLEVREYYPDFVFDLATRRASTRSGEPRNPVLRVALRDRETGRIEERWLSANAPDFDRGHGRAAEGPELRYQYLPARSPAEHEFVVVAETLEILEYRRGILQGRRRLSEGGGTEMARGVSAERLLPSAVEEPRYRSRSEEWRRPVAEVEIREDGRTAQVLLEPGDSIPLDPGGGYVLAFERKSDEAKAYRSRVSILEAGLPVRTGDILVNHPLSHGGFRLYQYRYDARGPSSGILAVRDPGLGVVYAGLVMVSLGMILSLFFRHRSKGAGGGSLP